MTLLRRIPALLLAVTLALALGIVPAPTLLLAAPAAQESAPAVMGYYESELIPGTGDTPDLVVGLILYEDGTAEVISDYQTEEDVIVEVGTWVDNGDGTLTLTVTGTIDGDYTAPIDLDFNIGDDGALVVPGAANGAFGEAGLTLLPTELGNREAILAEIPANALVFQSDVLPDDAGPGQQLTLAIFDDGSLTLVSDYMTAGEIVVEIGTWSESDDGSLIVTLTGQVEGGDGAITEYEVPLEFVFTVNDDSSLVLVDEGGALFGDAGLTLFPTEATGEAMEAATAEDVAEDAAAEGEATGEASDETEATPEVSEEATPEATEEPAEEATEEATEEPVAEETPEASEEEVVDESATEDETTDATTDATVDATGTTMTGTVLSGVYISDLLPGEAGSNTFLVTIFYDDGTIIFSTYPLNGEPPVTEVGNWADNDDGTYVITATGTLDEEYDEPFSVDFTLDEDGVVTISGVPLYPLAEIDLAAAPSLVAQFQSGLITATIESAHTLTLAVYDDSSAELVTEYVDGGDSYVEYGSWGVDEASDQFTITLTGDDDIDYVEPIEWVFDITPDGALVLANDDDGYYGEAGLTLIALEGDAAMMGEAMSDEAAGDEAATNEAATDEAATDEAATDEAATDEAATDEAATDEAATDEAATDEAATDEAATDEEAGAEDASADEGATAIEGAQLFQSDVLPAASSPGLQLTLGLLDDGRAAIDYDYLNDEEIITNTGEWVDNGDGTISITFTEGPTGTFDLPVEMTFELDDEGNLVIIDASEESSGLIDTVLAPVVLE